MLESFFGHKERIVIDVPYREFVTDLQNRRLPAVSWLVTTAPLSEYPS